MPKPRIPDPASIIYCPTCAKPTNGKGYHGPECQCGIKLGHGIEGAHGRGTNAPR